MHTINYGIELGGPSCPVCGSNFPLNQIIQRTAGIALGYCKVCKSSTEILLPEVKKKLVYLDQSFLSDTWNPTDASHERSAQRILEKIVELKNRQRILVIVSDIHCAETFAIPDERASKRDGIWTFENRLADGIITPNKFEVFLKQQQRALKNPNGPACFPLTDIGLEDPFRLRLGVQVLMTNKWRGRLFEQTSTSREQINARLREILERQAVAIGTPNSSEDCLSRVRQLWRSELINGISAVRNRAADITAIQQFLSNPSNMQFDVPAFEANDFAAIVSQITQDIGHDALSRFEALLEKDPNGGCACVRISTALEAEVLWSWCSADRTGTMTMNDRKFGLSRLNDISHVSTFLPYVDVMTTDNDMAKLCRRGVARIEIDAAKGKLFSADSYHELEAWLGDLANRPLEYFSIR